ncbi:PAS domain-containing sensor histidine kinase [Mucilaginibacter sp. 10I4]|uniref:PAS domain-containing sensor histidine kinase n=1 Tax=Mucilaginibacter sp. 10I4 TaxID=3048580 RepID=UPI002B2347F6|nr:PAS domain-containing sensor histidine kinase [Mucilaginibacter sp. 10I4]MEB0261789.1 PAS domain-containing sensor histidine kinase [Mucilaginibacter sp. 10I4]
MERFETVFENSLLGNKIISSDLKIKQVNPALVSLLGYDKKEDLIGTKILDFAPDYCHKDWALLQEKLWDKLIPSFSLESCLLKKDGTLVWCQITTILFEDQGETLGYTIIEDITEKYYLRLQKEEFISVASHELKTPITVLKANLEIIERKIKADTSMPPDLIKFTATAAQSVVKLNHLVNDLLNSTKIDRGELELHKTIFILSDVVKSCCTHIRLEGKYKIVYTGNHLIQVYADQFKIDQVLVNLVNNAVKYAPQSLKIDIHAEKIKSFTKITIIDKGQGIALKDQKKLFERYFRATANHKASGLGLGLYISSEIIKKHGGEIGVDSIVGEGSSFWFTIPDAH